MGFLRKSSTSKNSSKGAQHMPTPSTPTVPPAGVEASAGNVPKSCPEVRTLCSGEGDPVASPVEPAIDAVPNLIHDLEVATDPSGDRPARALRKLFALTEHDTFTTNRTEIVRVADGKLVPVLHEFLSRCDKGSSEKYLTLLVLNNVSVQSENKRWIAIDCGAAKILGKLLCEDPFCHLIAITLVNLTNADAALRKELALPDSEIQLIESLAFALRVASLTQTEYSSRLEIIDNNHNDRKTPRELLVNLLAEDLREGLNNRGSQETFPSPQEQLFPETARWCLTAIKNLTRPTRDADPIAARSLIQSGIVPHILRLIRVNGIIRAATSEVSQGSRDSGVSHSSSNDSPIPSPPPLSSGHFMNHPETWDSSSAQDAALFVVVNLVATQAARDYLRELDTVGRLSTIILHESLVPHETRTPETGKIVEFQCLKARMALAYLVGSEGYFGQPSRDASLYLNSDNSLLIMHEKQAQQFVDLFADTMSKYAQNAAGEFSASAFNVRYVLGALRCLLTNDFNQLVFAKTCALRLNSLLMKVLALHSVENVEYLDAHAAEQACFSLYLLSNYGLTDHFLPAMFFDRVTQNSLAAKIWTSYLQTETVTPAGKHASRQLLLRLKFLVFDTKRSSDLNRPTSPSWFPGKLQKSLLAVVVDNYKPGRKPMKGICDRPILRSVRPEKGSNEAPWDNRASVDAFPSALHAAHDFSFESAKVRHVGVIDDILIANNIANSANGEKTESYHYIWSWQDTLGEIQRNLTRQRSSDSTYFRTQNGGGLAALGIGLGNILCFSEEQCQC